MPTFSLEQLEVYSGSKITGIIHVGAGSAQEFPIYAKKTQNVIWIEALPANAAKARAKIAGSKNRLYEFAANTTNGTITFNPTTNLDSSSILKLGTHKGVFPTVKQTASITVESKRMEKFIDDLKVDCGVYSTLIIDVQGAELRVLDGMGKYLSKMNQVVVETNMPGTYFDCPSDDEVRSFMFTNHRLVSRVRINKCQFDSLYVRKR